MDKMTVIYGASDDLIEIDGELSEEFFGSSENKNYVSLSDGSVLEVKFEGLWRISLVVGGSLFDRIECGEDEEMDYTDKAYFKPGLIWAVCGSGTGRLKPKKALKVVAP